MYAVSARRLSAALEPPERIGMMRGMLRPILWGGLTSACTRPAISAALMLNQARGRVMRDVRTASDERESMSVRVAFVEVAWVE